MEAAQPPQPSNPPSPSFPPSAAPTTGEPVEFERLDDLNPQAQPPEPEPAAPVEPPAWVPFTGQELAVGVGLLTIALARPENLAEAKVYGNAFHGTHRLELPGTGLALDASVAEAFDSLRLGEALAAFGIQKPARFTGNLGDFPPVMRIAVGLGVAAFATWGGVRAVQNFREQNSPDPAGSSGGDSGGNSSA